MTCDITIRPGQITDHGWEFTVTFSGRQHKISLSQKYWKKLTNGGISPMDLIHLGIEEASDHHVVDSLPAEFDFEFLTSRVAHFEKKMRDEAKAEYTMTH